MRTVTFSDTEVARFVNDNFVPAWHDRGPGFHNDEPRTEQWIHSGSFESYPTKNICTFFLDADGKVFFYASGYWAPTFFLEIAKSALRLHTDPKAARGLAKRCEEIGRGVDTPKSDWCRPVEYRGGKHTHTQACTWISNAGFQYLGTVFKSFASGQRPKLVDIQSKYLYGNEFTEESSERATIDPTSFDRPKVASTETRTAPAALPPPTPSERKAKLRERYEALNARLLAMKLEDAARAALQDQLVMVVDEMTR